MTKYAIFGVGTARKVPPDRAQSNVAPTRPFTIVSYGKKVPRKTAPAQSLLAADDARPAAQAPARQSGPAIGEGLRRRLRGRGILARHLRPFPESLPAVRDFGARPRRPAQRQKGADGDDSPLVGGDDPLRRFRFRLPFRQPHAAVEGGQRQQVHVPHLRLRHRELPLLRPLAAQRLRESHQERYAHLRLREVHARIFVHDLPAVRLVCLLGAVGLGERLSADRLQTGGAHRLPRHREQRGKDPRMAPAQRHEARRAAPPAQPADARTDEGV